MENFIRLNFTWLLLTVFLNLTAQQTYLVKDISPITLPSDPVNLAKIGNFIFFFANDGIHGKELWKTDGTATGTTLVKDIYPGKESSISYRNGQIKPVVVNNIFYFVADNGVADDEIWRTDGTTQGTYLLKDIGNGWYETPGSLTNFNGMLYFVASGGFWKSNGTSSGTILVKEIYPSNLIVVNSSLFFTTSDNFDHLSKLWKSDGTMNGTVVVKEINGYNVFGSEQFIAYNNRLYFSVDEIDESEKLWVSDGTTFGTFPMLGDTGQYVFTPSSFAVSNHLLFFMAYNSSWDSELWISDGSSEGTKSIYTFQSIYTTQNADLIDYNGDVYFVACDSTVGNLDPFNRSFWKSNGTNQGTEFIKVINTTNPYSRNQFTVFDNNLYMEAYDSLTGYELWKSDGTFDGTQLIKNIYPASGSSRLSSLTPLNDKLIFSANDNEHDFELWISDGTESGTSLLKDINSIGDSHIDQLTKIDEKLFFSAKNVANGWELWKSDGTNTGTNMVIDIAPPNLIGPQYLSELNGYAYFYSPDNTYGGVYKSDGTVSGTEMIKVGSVHGMVEENNYLYGSYPGFWKSDGTAQGTVLITNNVDFDKLITVNDILYLQSYFALFRSDGTESGTILLKYFNYLQGITSINNKVYFCASVMDSLYNNVSGLWTSDGTSDGTVVVKEMSAYNTTSVGGTLFFSGSDTLTNYDSELWKSDGTASGTVLVKNINLTEGSDPKKLTDINGELYFVADDGIHGYELWKSDGTDTGTYMIKDINNGLANSFSSLRDSIPDFVVIDSLVYFTAYDEVHGFELWQTDGTETGTTLVSDINTVGSSFPNFLTNVDGTLFFTAYENTHGRELWAYGIPTKSCLAEGISFLTQAEVNDFQINYPGCERIEGEVIISGSDITNLSMLNVLTSLGDDLKIYNTTDLTNLTGLEHIVTIDGSLIIGNDTKGGNTALTSILGLTNLSAIQGDLVIRNNAVLTTLSGLDNTNSETIADLVISDNALLSICEVESVCDYLSILNGSVEIQNNAIGCSSQSEVLEACADGISDVSKSSAFNIYPNPAKNEIYIYNNSDIHLNDITIYNPQGKKVLHRAGISDKIDISTLQQGMYIIELTSNESSIRKKLIIK